MDRAPQSLRRRRGSDRRHRHGGSDRPARSPAGRRQGRGAPARRGRQPDGVRPRQAAGGDLRRGVRRSRSTACCAARHAAVPSTSTSICRDLLASVGLSPADTAAVRDATVTLDDGRRVRLPRGSDELAVQGMSAEAAEAALFARCIVEGDAAPGDAAVHDALEAAAPILDTELDAACPECGAPTQAHFDLQHYLLTAILQETPRGPPRSICWRRPMAGACAKYWNSIASADVPSRPRSSAIAAPMPEASSHAPISSKTGDAIGRPTGAAGGAGYTIATADAHRSRPAWWKRRCRASRRREPTAPRAAVAPAACPTRPIRGIPNCRRHGPSIGQGRSCPRTTPCSRAANRSCRPLRRRERSRRRALRLRRRLSRRRRLQHRFFHHRQRKRSRPCSSRHLRLRPRPRRRPAHVPRRSRPHAAR